MQGMIAAGSPFTAQAGVAMLHLGGNAVDAAVAAAFASFIAEVGVVNLGGSGVAHVYDPDQDRSVVYDFFSTMPGIGATGQRSELDFERVTVNYGPTTQDFFLGRGSVAVPGNIFGLCQLADQLGTLPLSTILQPAIDLAQEAHAIRWFQAETVQLLERIYTHTERMRDVFLIDGRIMQTGDPLFIPDLAATLAEIAERGADVLRSGRVADALVADQAKHGGLLTAQDLNAYRVSVGTPIRVAYRDVEALLPRTSGGILTAFTLTMLQSLPDVGQFAPDSAETLLMLRAAMATTSHARVEWERWQQSIGVAEATERLLSAETVNRYTKKMRTAINAKRPQPDPPEAKTPNNTSHLSVIDADGMAVSLTTTAGETAGFIVPETGIILNNMLGEADLNPHGWHQWPTGSRLATMMTPTIVRQNGQTRLVTGSGGSARIRSAILQVLSNVVDHRLDLVDAVNRPRVHLEKELLQCEAGFNPTEVDRLAAWGYPTKRWQKRSIYFGGAHSVMRDNAGRLAGCGDARRDGATAT